jgi:hypothetical protein
MQEEDESTQKEGGCMHIEAESMQEDGLSACREKAVHAGRKRCMQGESGACTEKVVHAEIGVDASRKRKGAFIKREQGFTQKYRVGACMKVGSGRK